MSETPPTQSVPSTETGHVSEALMSLVSQIPSDCNACGKPLMLVNLFCDDVCPCNSLREVNVAPKQCVLCGIDNCVKVGHRVLELFQRAIDSASPWIKTADRPPTEKDSDKFGGEVLVALSEEIFTTAYYKDVIKFPKQYPLWMPIPPVPQQQNV